MGKAYYNEWDKYAAAWLRDLIQEGLIAPGDVDERSIRDVQPADLDGYTQCHFFAGIGGWSLALRLAGVPDEFPVWTGSCPCQPFSVAGKMLGVADDRHLWPEFYRLIGKRRPPVIFGEQVANAPDWLRGVRSDLEAVDYAVGCMPIEAASAGADHFRDRYWFVADMYDAKRRPVGASRDESIGDEAGRQQSDGYTPECGEGGSPFCLADSDEQRQGDGQLQRSGELGGSGRDSQDSPGALADGHGQRSQIPLSESRDIGAECAPVTRGGVQRLANTQHSREGRRGLQGPGESSGPHGERSPSQPPGSGNRIFGSDPWGPIWTEREFRDAGFTAAVANIDGRQFVECPDGKWRGLPPPRVRWLGTRIPARVAKLRAIGNAIDWRPAASFIGAYLESRGLLQPFAPPQPPHPQP